jgi:N-acetylglucosaminyl-diphospho-decaprenol L-rhamnosyltransferase
MGAAGAAICSRVKLSYCVVNTNGREHLARCLGAIRRTHPAGMAHEVLVLDNASDDGSVEALEEWIAAAGDFGRSVRVIARDRRAGKAENDSLLLREAQGELCLLLNEDSELREGATAVLVDALSERPRAAVAGAQLLDPDGRPLACAWRLPGLGTSVAQALFLHRRLVTESGGEDVREVGWVQSAAMLVRRSAAAEVGFLDPHFFVYSDETDFCKRLRDGGWSILHVPQARAIHHEQLATDRAGSTRRIVEFHRGRELYMRKHHSPPVAALARLLAAWSYVPRAAAALVVPGHSPRRYWLHARQALRPAQGEGLREAAAAYNHRLASGDVRHRRDPRPGSPARRPPA